MVQSKRLNNFATIKHYFLEKDETPEEFDIDIKNLYQVDQVHSNKIVVVREKGFEKKFFRRDGMVTKDNIYLAIKTADCMPIFLVSREKRIIAAIHVGWRGLITANIPNTLRIMEKMNIEINKISVAIGPHIGKCCYAVSAELVKKFQQKTFNKNKMIIKRKNDWFLNLGQIAKYQMQKFGVPDKNIDIIDICTSCSHQFYSYRRDGTRMRMWNVIGQKNI